jgi:NADH-quinone oxidoreductase subunit H
VSEIVALLFFPGGLFVLAGGMAYEWADRKLVARLQNRQGPRWFQPLADTVKLLAKEEVIQAILTSSCSWGCRLRRWPGR